MKTIIYKDEAGEWRWKVVAKNGKIVADSGEGYTSKSAAQAGLKRVSPEGYIEPEN